MERVFVVKDDRAILRLVKTGARRGDQVEILTGIFDGDAVVINPPGTLRETQPLKVQP
jgi:multidrug efflux pump subunit AcrA (membrane-fusion protein)